MILGLFVARSFTIVQLALQPCLLQLILNLLVDEHDTLSTLSATIILLNEPDCLLDIDVERERILNHLNLWLVTLANLVHELTNKSCLLDEWHGWWLLIALIIVLLLLLFLLLLWLLFLLTALLLNWLLKDEVELDSVILTEVTWHRDLNHRWIVLQIEEKLVEMHIKRILSRVELRDLELELADPTNGALEYFLYEDTLLRMHALIVALFELPVDIDVLYVEYGEVLEHLVLRPVHEHGLASLVLLRRLMLVLHLLLQLVNRVLQLQIVCT